MTRQRTVIVDQDEDIISYEHHIAGRFVRILVGAGTAMPDGTFIAAESQNYESFIVQEADYDLLLAARVGTDPKPEGVFRKDDLWQFVDIGRQKAEAERELIAQRTADQAAQPVKGGLVV